MFEAFRLSPAILEALQALQYRQPTEVQQMVIPKVLEQIDITVQAQTGSGKTAAFAIPICELVTWEENKPQAIVLTPTRELAQQVKEEFIHIGRFKRVKAIALFGKQPFDQQKIELKQKNHVVVGTPGRVLDHIRKGTLPLEKIRYLVIDEADIMLNMGFIDQVQSIIKALPRERNTLLFSATFPDEIKALTLKYQKQPEQIQVKMEQSIEKLVHHAYVEVSKDEKFDVLHDVLVVENPDRCVIFCKTQEQVNEIDGMLADLGLPCDKLHGGMVQDERFAVMDDFKRGVFRYLIATDVAARGIDVEQVSLVINYEWPRDIESYVHRTGRTGRAGKTGKAISLLYGYQLSRIEQLYSETGIQASAMAAPTSEQAASGQAAFDEKIQTSAEVKKQRSDQVNKNITKLYFNGGKKKKLRAIDFVGTIAKIDGMTAADIGIITIQEQESYVEILNGKGDLVLYTMKHTPIKGKQLKVHKAK